MIRFKHRSLLLALALLLSAQTATAQGEGGDTQKVVVDKAVLESMMRIIAQTAGNLGNVNDIVNSAACSPPVIESGPVSGESPTCGDSAGSLSRRSLDKLQLCLASLQVALSGGGQGEEQPLPSNWKCLDVTGEYSCPGGFEAYINFSKRNDGRFVYDVEYSNGSKSAYYQYKVDDRMHSGEAEGKYIASCRRKSMRVAFPVEGKDRYRVEEYTLDHRRDLEVNIYIEEIPGGNMNNTKRLENEKFFTCTKI